jgi:DNA replication protein DnaC
MSRTENEISPIAIKLARARVPHNLIGATFDNWKPKTNEERSHLETVERFAKSLQGFLLLLGNVGTGKSHLAVAIMHQAALSMSVLLYRQPDLLKSLRDSYDDRGPDPRDKCAGVGLLVLDELGLVSGGKDELPLVCEIIEQRYSSGLPLVVTSNLPYEELAGQLGPRIRDRIRGATFAALVFSGDSHRASCREDYLASDNRALRQAIYEAELLSELL